MTEQMKKIVAALSNTLILAGLFIFAAGSYYAVIKAGIPYQDPPLELQIQYAVYQGTGEVLCKLGFFTLLCGSGVRLILWLIKKKGNSIKR